MKQKSQIDAMRAALRGDLERARERRGATLLDRAEEPETAETALPAEPEPDPEPEPEPVGIEQPEPEPEPEPVAIEEPEPEPKPQGRLFSFFRKRG